MSRKRHNISLIRDEGREYINEKKYMDELFEDERELENIIVTTSPEIAQDEVRMAIKRLKMPVPSYFRVFYFP